MNQWRSLTAETIYRSDSRLEVRSAGTRTDAKRRLQESDLFWADVVFVMDREPKSWILTRYRGSELPRIEVLDIPDEYQFMDPRLVEALRLAIEPELEALFTSDGNSA